jgi:hypothetical protein
VKMILKIVIGIIIIICVGTVGFVAWYSFNTHPDPIFNIGNNFNQTVTVYFNGKQMGKINSGESKIFYPNEVLTTTDSNLSLELKSTSNLILFSRQFTWDELSTVLESVGGKPYWIGDQK